MTEQATPDHRIGLSNQVRASDSIVGQAQTNGSSHEPTDANHSASVSHNGDSQFGDSLSPVLRAQCDGRLSEINWFRTDWQRGGALTGYATWTGMEDETYPVVVKMPVPPRERRWLLRLQSPVHGAYVVPRVFASGEAVGGYDLVWVVMERLPHGPLGNAWDAGAFELTVEAAARFHKAASSHPPDGKPREQDWDDVLRRARKHIRDQDFPHAARWSASLKKASKKLGAWSKVWDARPLTDHVHGDLHLGNAMSRHAPPDGPAVLFDLAHVRPGHWVEDAVYFEHLYWSWPRQTGERRIVSDMARARKAVGLAVDSGWPRLAQVERALTAMSAPVMLHHRGSAQHICAALEVLEREVA